jgi:alkane 1-monooxygenase
MHPMSELPLRLPAVLLLPGLTLFCIFWDAAPGAKLAVWGGWLVLALLQDWLAPRVVPVGNGGNGAALGSLASAPLLAHSAALAAALWAMTAAPTDPSLPELAAWAGMLGISAGTVGISAAHELVHRRSRFERGLAQAFMLLVTYPHFPLVHLRVHHVWVGTAVDPGTSRRGEPLLAFMLRAIALAWKGGWRSESRRLARLRTRVWGWRNRMLRVVVMQAAVLAGVLLAAGPGALAFFLAQSMVAVFLMLAVDYTQHYGVERREIAPGRLEPVRAGHAWTTDHASNRTTFNLGLHADHHLAPGRTYPHLGNAQGSLQAPFGYPGLVLLALVPPLWFRVMNPRLAAPGSISVSGPA